jgi:hypothetical protein
MRPRTLSDPSAPPQVQGRYTHTHTHTHNTHKQDAHSPHLQYNGPCSHSCPLTACCPPSNRRAREFTADSDVLTRDRAAMPANGRATHFASTESPSMMSENQVVYEHTCTHMLVRVQPFLICRCVHVLPLCLSAPSSRMLLPRPCAEEKCRAG